MQRASLPGPPPTELRVQKVLWSWNLHGWLWESTHQGSGDLEADGAFHFKVQIGVQPLAGSVSLLGVWRVEGFRAIMLEQSLGECSHPSPARLPQTPPSWSNDYSALNAGSVIPRRGDTRWLEHRLWSLAVWVRISALPHRNLVKWS